MALTRFRFTPSFSYNLILAGTSLLVPAYQQMFVYQEIQVEATAELVLEGELVLVD